MVLDSAQKQGMRKRFELSPTLGLTSIADVKISLKSRDELAPVSLTLKTIFMDADYHKRMFEIVEPVIQRDKKQIGREGMTIWEVIVLAVVRMSLNTNYDRLLWISNNDLTIRKLMGIHDPAGWGYGKEDYSLTALKENIGLLKLDTIEKVNELVLEVGAGYLKKKTLKILSSKPIITS